MESPVKGYKFDNITLDLKNRRLLRNGDMLALSSKYFDVLSLLVARHGELTTKEEIFDAVWGDVIVTDTALSQCIKDIRKRLGDNASRPKFIKTVPKHGYVFIANVYPVFDSEKEPDSVRPAGLPVRPYKFLDYYTENDAGIFFGREEESRTIASKVLAHRTFILHGRSGVGKSSVIRAGVIPLLKQQDCDVKIIRSFIDPVHQIRDTLMQMLKPEDREKAGGGSGFPDVLERLTIGRPVIFIFDQFEELFSMLSDENRKQFIAGIGSLRKRESLPVHLVFVLREDLLAEMSQIKQTIPDIFYYEYRLQRLTREQAATAIREPARLVGCRYEDALISRLLDDLSVNDKIDPPQLQIVCDVLYDDRDTRDTLTLGEYDSLGGSQKILAGYLERVLSRFSPAELECVQTLLKNFIGENNQGMVLRQSELEGRVCEQSAASITGVNVLISELIAARIIRCRRQEGESWIELAHDFLIPEISSWVTAEEYALKRAYGIVERALENFRTHQLLVDVDALDRVLPFADRLRLTGEEYDLLARSLLSRGKQVPSWLARKAPDIRNQVLEASTHADPSLRISAIESCHGMQDDIVKEMLLERAFWDPDLMVRKAASIAYAEWFGPFNPANFRGKGIGLKRKAISMAFIRDYDKNLIHLSGLPFPVAVIIVLGLMLVRFKRHSREILIRTLGGTAGAAFSGLAIGFFLGVGLVFAKPSPPYDTVSLLLVLSSLGTIAGAFGGFGICAGMVSVQFVTFRHSRWWSVMGAGIGGAVIGAFLNVLGVDILKSLFGHNLSGITGALEGALIGTGLALGILLASGMKGRYSARRRIAGAAVGAMGAAVLLSLIGGNMFSGSLDIIARSFAHSQLKFDTLASFFGESQFGKLSRVALGAIEGLLFGGFLAGGIELLGRNGQEK